MSLFPMSMLSVCIVTVVDCAGVHASGATTSGVYTVYPTGNDDSLSVFCDLATREGGWLVGTNIDYNQEISFCY